MANNAAWWKLKIEPSYYNGAHTELSESDLEHISQLIKEGYTEGEIVKDEEDSENANSQ